MLTRFAKKKLTEDYKKTIGTGNARKICLIQKDPYIFPLYLYL